MRQFVITTLALFLFAFWVGGCSKKATTQIEEKPSPTPTQPISSPTTITPNQSPPSAMPVEISRDPKTPENLIFLWGTLDIPDDPVKIEGAKDTSGKELKIYTYPNLTVNAEFNGEKIKADVTSNTEKVITIVLKVKKSYKSYSKIDMLSFEMPGYSQLVLSNIPIDKNGSVNLKTIVLKKNN